MAVAPRVQKMRRPARLEPDAEFRRRCVGCGDACRYVHCVSRRNAASVRVADGQRLAVMLQIPLAPHPENELLALGQLRIDPALGEEGFGAAVQHRALERFGGGQPPGSQVVKLPLASHRGVHAVPPLRSLHQRDVQPRVSIPAAMARRHQLARAGHVARRRRPLP